MLFKDLNPRPVSPQYPPTGHPRGTDCRHLQSWNCPGPSSACSPAPPDLERNNDSHCNFWTALRSKQFWALESFSSSKTTKVVALMATIDVNSSTSRAFCVVSFKALAVHHAKQSVFLLNFSPNFSQAG